jgi:hypothetical protein
MRLALVAPTVLAALAISGCGSGGGTTTSTSSPPPAAAGETSTPAETTATERKENCAHPSEAEPCEGKALEEKKRKEGEGGLVGAPPSEQEQKHREAKEAEVKKEVEQIEEGKRLKEGK